MRISDWFWSSKKEMTRQFNKLNERISRMSAALDRLTTEVQENRDATQAAVTLITGLAQQIRDAIGNEDALNALADSLDEDQTAIAEAVTANTPASPETPTEPDEE